MPATLAVSCPNCGTGIKVPAELAGKKIKCKACQQVFAVTAPAAPAAKPAAKPAPAPPPPPPAVAAHRKDLMDTDDDGANPYTVTHESDAPRCPFCAKEMDPPDARICKNCGYDMQERRRREQKKVYQRTVMDWAKHLGPGILCLVVGVGLLVANGIAIANMTDWLTGTFFESDEKGLDGQKKWNVNPGLVSLWMFVITGWVIIRPCLIFAYKRLVNNFYPEEKIKRD